MSRHSPAKVNLIAWTIRLIVKAISATYRVRFATEEDCQRLEAMAANPSPAILCCWHNRIFFFADFLERQLVHRGYTGKTMISMSKDGDIGTRLAELAGVSVIRASSSRGGARGLRELHRVLDQEKLSVFVLPDGPRGPRYELKKGVIALAQMTGAPVIPLSWAPARAWTLRSWDRFIIPKPFTKVTVGVGEPVEVVRQKGSELQEAERERVQNILRKLTERTEREADFAQ